MNRFGQIEQSSELRLVEVAQFLGDDRLLASQEQQLGMLGQLFF